MKTVIINEKYLKDNDIEMNVIRVKGLLINSKGKILLAHNNYTYQFPGGHKEDNEEIDECIKREIKEETGISVDILEKPFLNIITYDDNYFNTGKKVKNSIYYYRFFTDQAPNYEDTHYDKLELETDFNLFYVEFSKLKDFINKGIKDGEIDLKIAKEMLLVISIYNDEFGGII